MNNGAKSNISHLKNLEAAIYFLDVPYIDL